MSLVATLLTTLFFASLSHAAPNVKPVPVTPPLTPTGPAKRSLVMEESDWKPWSVNLVTGYMDYKEPGLMREYGIMSGVQGIYSYLSDSGVQYQGEASFLLGQLKYDGGNLAGKRYTQPTNDWIIETRGTIGLYRNFTPSWSITPYAGLGFRDLNDKIQGSGSYNRNISYVYLPLGVQLAGFFDQTWSLSLTGDLDLMVYGTVISSLSDVDSSAPDVTNHNKGLGGRLTASVRKDLGRWALRFGALYQKWKIDQSDGVKLTIGSTTGTLYEPENEFDFFGFTIGADF